MEISLTEVLTVYGPLGTLALVGLYAAAKMFYVLQAERQEYDQRLDQLNTAHREELQKIGGEHKAEMQAMIERYIRTTTSQVEQYHTLADKISAVLASLTHRVRR